MKKILLFVLPRILPHGSRKNYWAALKKSNPQPLRLAIETLSVAPEAYREQWVNSFNLWSTLGSFVIAVFCFLTANLSWGKAIAAIAVVGAVQFYEAYKFGVERRKDASKMRDNSLNAGGQAVAAGVAVVASQALILKLAPAWRAGGIALWCSVALCLPLLAVLRMALTNRPDPDAPPAGGLKMKPRHLYLWARYLNGLWFLTFYLLVALNVTDIRGYWGDVLRGLTAFLSFGVSRATQKFSLRRHSLGSVFTYERVEIERWKANLAQGLKKGDPLLWLHWAMEGLILAQIAWAMADAVMPWLKGSTDAMALFNFLAAVGLASACVLSWMYMKKTNRNVAEALQRYIDFEMPRPIGR